MGGCFGGSKPDRDPTGGGGGAPRGSTMSAPANSAVDDFLMDTGLKKKNDVYDRDLAERRARGAAANEELIRRDDNDSAAVSAPVVDTAVTTTTTADTGTVLGETVDTSLTEVETIGDQTFGDDRDFTGDATGTASVGTAAGGQAQFDAASATSVGEAEDAALEMMKKGRRSTILTKPGGLLGSGEDDGKTRLRRSLIGG
tara:strand:+ start:1936 stop:2535 length:600 start_codon:yes stop_codon:yes gene_type:complete